MRRRRPTGEAPECLENGWAPPQFGGDLLVVLAYPGPYRAGMSSLGYQTILYGFSTIEGVRVQRLFLDEADGSLHSPDGPLRLKKTAFLAFSIAAENDYLNVLRIMDAAGLPLAAGERNDGYPVVLAGGIAVSLNPEPLAAFVDCFVIGEGEEALAGIVGTVGDRKGKRLLLEELASLEGLYVPAFYEPAYSAEGTLSSFTSRPPARAGVRRLSTADLDAHPAFSRVVAPESEFGDLFLLEINRGCGRGCRFCAAGHLIRPLRHRSTEGVLETVSREAPAALRRCGILGSAVADHPGVEKIMASLLERGMGISVSSLRIDRVGPGLLKLLKEGGCRSVTFAPETGSERLRKAVNKPISDDQIVDAVGEAVDAGIASVKLYFMIGLPGEDEADREAIPALLRRVQGRLVSRSRRRGRIGTISVSVSCFVPKAWTPFQWHPFLEVAELKGALARLAGAVRKIPNVTMSYDSPRNAYVQAFLSRADRRGAALLEGAFEHGGNWGKALRTAGVDAEHFVYRQRGRDELFPWDFIVTGLRKERLWREYRKALDAGRGEEP